MKRKDEIYQYQPGIEAFHQNKIQKSKQSTHHNKKTAISNTTTKQETPSNTQTQKTIVIGVNSIDRQEIQKKINHISNQYKEQRTHCIRNNTQRSYLSSSFPQMSLKCQISVLQKMQINSQILTHIHQFIINVFDKSQDNLIKLSHVLIPYGLVLLENRNLTKSKTTYVHKRFIEILQLLNNPHLQDQINFPLFRKVYQFFIKYQNKTQKQIIQMLIEFLTSQRNIMQALCPYYLNLFIMIVNKNKVFIDSNSTHHIMYTIQIDHPRYEGQFTVADVKRELMRLNNALTNSYNSNQI